MRPSRSNQSCRALTLVELMVTIAVLAVMVELLLTALSASHGRQSINCVNNLKQVDLSYRLWAGDNNDKFPMEVSVTNGGTMELVGGTDVWKTFQVMSNELITPQTLICPQDAEHGNYATNFGNDLKGKISYFVGLDSTTNSSSTFLSGDDNFEINGTPIKSGLLELFSTNAPIAWSAARHKFAGNILLADGSVQSVTISGLANLVQQTGLVTNRLAIP